MGCDECPPYGIVGFAGFDSFKGISDLVLPSNFGVVTGLNAGVPIPGLRDYGFGWQIGLSYGVYDLDGRVAAADESHSQQQTFVTTGFFRKAQCDQRLSFGVVYDWMYNTEWGIAGNDPTMGQWRGQIEYAASGCNGIGLWAPSETLLPFSASAALSSRIDRSAKSTCSGTTSSARAPTVGCGSVCPTTAGTTATRASPTG